jgi:protein-S-isoprenylcysteine O-methyltransferase Ste14
MGKMLQTRYLIAVALWVGWSLPFIHKAGVPRQRAVARDPTARWGIILEAVAFGVVWGTPAYEIPMWRVVIALLWGAAGIVTTRIAVLHLDKQWRFDAAINANHLLVQSGPYSVVRHPIYAGIFAMLLATGFLLARWPVLVIGVVLFLVGTEIRVRAEEKLLRSRFGEEFEAYARRVSAYVPFVR